MLGPLMSHELRYCADSIWQWRRTGVHGLTKVHYHHNTTLPAQEEDLKSAYEERKPVSDFTVAFENSRQGVICAKRLKLRVQILFQVT